MKKLIILTISAVIISSLAIAIYSLNFTATARVIQDTADFYSYTTAVCNSSNFCQDYEIICKKNEIINQSKITGAFIQHSLDWKDPRRQKKLCD